MRKPEVVPLTQEHMDAFNQASCENFFGVAVELDGEPVAIGGYVDHGEVLEVFSDVRGGSPVSVVRAAIRVLESLPDKPAFCLQAKDKPRSAAFLSRLGFTCMGEVDGEIVWRY